MKQKLLRLTRLRALVLTAVMCVLSAGQAWAAEEVYKTARFGKAYNDDNSSYTGSFEATNEGFVVTVKYFNNNRNAWTNTSGYGQIKCGRKSYESVGIISTKEAIDQAITKVVVTIDAITASSVNSIKLYTSSNGSSWTAAGSFTKATGAQAVTLATPAADLYYKIEFDCKSASSNGVITVSKVEYYYNTSGASAPTISSDNVEITYDATSGSIAYTLANEVSGGSLSASVPSSSWITLGNGTSSPISFTCEANSSAVARTETVTLTYTYNTNETVTKDVTVTQAGNPNGSGSENTPYTVAQARAAIDAGSGTQGVYATGIVTAIPTEWSTQHSNITFNIVDQSGDTDFLQAYRCVSGSGVDASTVEVGDIVVVKGNLTKYGSTYEFSQGCELVSLTHPVAAIEKPTFTPAAGTYTDAQNVTISCATDGATIYYTTDGTEPTSASTQYTGAIDVSTATTIKAIAIKGTDESTVATASYHFCSATSPYTVTEALAFSEYPANGIYVSGIVSTAPTQAPTADGQMTYYISVDGQANNQLEVYKGKGLDQAAFTAKDDIQVGDEVTIYGNVKVYNSTIEFDSGNYLVAFNRPSAPVGTIALNWNIPDGVTVHIVNAEDNSMEYSNGDKVAKNTTIKVVIDKPSYYEVSSLRVNDGTQNFDMATYANWVFTVLNDGDITITISVTDTRTVTDLSYASDGSQWDASTQTVTISSASEFVQPALFINNGTPIDSEITYSSSNTAVATVGTDGTVTIVGPGTAVITATFAGNNDYQPSWASFNIVYNGTVVDYAELPFAWAGGAKADLNAVTGVTTTGLGSDYGDTHNPYLVKLDGTGDYIQVKTNERPGVVTIGVKMIGGSNTSTITVQGSADGTTFTDVQELTISGKQNAELTLTTTNEFAETDRYVRLYFTKGSNVGVGPISIAQYTAPSTDPVINASDVNITADATEGEIAYTITHSVTGTALTATSNDAWISNINVEADKVTFDCDPNTGDERTATITLSYTGAADKVITVTQGAYVAPFTPTTYTLATAITSGKHYIIVGEKEGTYKAMGTQNTNNRKAEVVTVANDQATVSTADVKEVVICGPTTDGLYTIYDANAGGFLYAANSSNNYLRTEAPYSIDGLWEITFDATSGAASIVATQSSNRNVMQYNSSSSLFSCYATDSQAPVYLYEKVSDTPVAANYTRTATVGNYGTICLPNNATIAGAELYSIDGVDSNTAPTELNLTKVYVAQAGVPYIFKATASTINAYYTGDAATAAGSANGLIGSFEQKNITNAAGEPVTTGENPYVIKNNKFCKAGTNVKVGANKAYINLNDVPVSTGSNPVKMFIDADADGIDGINGEIRSGVIYNIAGQRLQRPVRGINIINGKKVLVK